MRYLTLPEVIELHRRIVETTGGSPGIRDSGMLASALSQPRMTFAGQGLYPTLSDKAAALAFSLIQNHAFVDGNKRVGHAAMETFLIVNEFELAADLDEQEQIVLGVASGSIERARLTDWLTAHVRPISPLP